MDGRGAKRKIRKRRRFLKRAARVSVLTVMMIGITILAMVTVKLVCAVAAQCSDQWDTQSAGMMRTDIKDYGNMGNTELLRKLEAEGYPESLIELMEKHPETKEFVLGYMENRDKDADINVSKEVSQGEIPLFLQWDERWGYKKYGSDFIAVTGCGPVCLSMVRCGLSGDAYWNPLEVARIAEKQGYYVDGAGSSWDLMVSGAEQIGLMAYGISFDESSILSELQAGTPIICVVGPGDFTTTGHFIVLAGADADGNIIVRDPNSRRNSEKTWRIEELMPQIRNLWGYYLS